MMPIHRTLKSVFNYDSIPPGYYFNAMLTGSTIQRFWHREKFNEIAQRVSDGETVLDFGCGPGSFLSVLVESKPKTRATGADVASAQLNFASGKLAHLVSSGQVNFLQISLDQEKVPLPDKSFDVLTIIEVIEHIHPHLALKMLQEASRLLKDTGRIVITTPNYRSTWPLLEYLLNKLSPVKYHDQHISKFTPNSFVKFVETAGFQVTHVNSIFFLSPFLAVFSRWFALRVLKWERRSRLLMGNLLVIEAQKIDWSSPS